MTIPESELAIELAIAPRPSLLVKRYMDVAVAGTALIALAPLLLLIAALVRLDSRGPSLFCQDRVGLNGRLFTMLKFRTMATGSSDEPHRQLVARLQREGADRPLCPPHLAAQKLTNDPRVTRLGGWLRRWSLDELPQLINVLRGEMSLVGPRPLPTYEDEGLAAWQRRRLRMLPGMTGLWQVSGRSSLSYHRMCELDLEYVFGWSFWLDVAILLKTVPAVCRTNSTA